MISGIHNLHSKIGFVVITTLHVRGSAESQALGYTSWLEQPCSALLTTRKVI